MDKSKLTKAQQKKASKVCQKCGECCHGGASKWIITYAEPADFERWGKSEGVTETIKDCLWRTIAIVQQSGIQEIQELITTALGPNYAQNNRCGCLRKDAKTGLWYCLIEKKHGYEMKPSVCRYHECQKLVKGVEKAVSK